MRSFVTPLSKCLKAIENARSQVEAAGRTGCDVHLEGALAQLDQLYQDVRRIRELAWNEKKTAERPTASVVSEQLVGAAVAAYFPSDSPGAGEDKDVLRTPQYGADGELLGEIVQRPIGYTGDGTPVYGTS